jgi:hypothetical protein
LKILQIEAEDYHSSYDELDIVRAKVGDHDGDPVDEAN